MLVLFGELEQAQDFVLLGVVLGLLMCVMSRQLQRWRLGQIVIHSDDNDDEDQLEHFHNGLTEHARLTNHHHHRPPPLHLPFLDGEAEDFVRRRHSSSTSLSPPPPPPPAALMPDEERRKLIQLVADTRRIVNHNHKSASSPRSSTTTNHQHHE